MKGLTELIKESLVNEMRVPAQIKRLKSEVEEVESSDWGSGWLIGGWFSDDKTFDEVIKDCIKAFKGVIIAGETVNKPISLDDAYQMLEDNGEEPEGDFGFVFIEGSDMPELYSEIAFTGRW